MKKLCLASIILTVSISLVGCTNSGVARDDNQNNTESSTQNSNESKVPNRSESGAPNNNANNNANNTGDISLDKAKEIALSHAGLTSNQVTFKRTELESDDGIQKYEVEFYYNNIEYSYEIDANSGNILSYEQD
ncbi:MAG: hypothetical protein E7212_08285 [Clostridium sartagoforme]|nr:hypothetical protein [Clostridium sartagoforme]